MDPSGKNAGYIYAGNNPINNSDPSGLSWEDPLDTLGDGLSGCAVSAAGAFATAAAISAVTSGAGLGISGAELGLSCTFGFLGGAIDSLAGPGASIGVNGFDIFLTFRGF